MAKSDDYSEHFSEDSFWEKVKKYALMAGKEVIEKALVLYCACQDPDTPAWAKAVIISALGYFILPLDAIPDFTPIVGYSDDLGALIVALAAIGVHVKEGCFQEAEEQLKRWFGRKGGKDGDGATVPG